MQVRKVARILPPLPSPPFFFPYSSLTFVCGAKCPFLCHWSTSFQWSFFCLLPYLPAILPSHPPMEATLCMCLSQKKRSWQKKGCPELWKQHRSGLSLALNGVSTSRRIGARRQMCVCLSQSLAVHLLAPHLPTQPGFYVKQRPQTEAEGAEWVPERFGYNNKICVFHLASRSLLFLLVSQEIQCSVGRLNAFEVLEEMDCW